MAKLVLAVTGASGMLTAKTLIERSPWPVSPAMNTGSRLILLATDRPSGPLRTDPPKPPPDPGEVQMDRNRLVLHFPIAIDAKKKTGYRKPVAFDHEIAARVNDKWSRYGIDGY